jgi:hypothetical protein
MILQQIKRGQSVIVKEVVLNDITTFSSAELAELTKSPIIAFIKKYQSYALFFQSKFISDGPPKNELPFFDPNGTPIVDTASETYYSNVFSAIWNAFVFKKVDPITKPTFKAFVYDFFRAYILQYGIEGATTNEGKIAKLYPYWVRYIGHIHIKMPDGMYLKKAGKNETQTSTAPTTSVATKSATIFSLFGITEAKLQAFALDTSPTPAVPA